MVMTKGVFKMEFKKPKPNFFLYLAVFSVNLLAINSSSMFSWSSPSIPILTSNDNTINPLGRPITSTEESLIASLSTLGSVVGTLFAGVVAEKLGRKNTLIIFSMPYFFCYLIIANTAQIYCYFVTRFILGLATGCVLSVLPSYVGEISEDSNRGALSSVFGIMNNVGHFLTFAIGPLVSIQTFAYILMVPVTLFLITFIPFVPESPYHHLSKGNTNKAKKSLKKIRSNKDIEKELIYISEIVKESKDDKVTIKDVMSSVVIKKGLLVSCGLLLFQQGLGIGIILIYLQPVLEASGNFIPSYIASMIIAIIQIISCCIATIVIDSLGRKILLHISSAGSSLSLFALGTYFIMNENNFNLDTIFWLPVVSLITYYIFFNIGYATIPWSFCGELFATNVKSLCASVASCVCLIFSFLVTLCFPFLRDAFGMGGVFCFFGFVGALASIFVILFVPETKGKSFQEIQDELRGKQKFAKCSGDCDSS